MQRISIFLLIIFHCFAFAKFFPAFYVGYHKLTEAVTVTQLERHLFNTPAGVAIIRFSDTDRASFVVDEGWHRIVYSRDGADWIKTWGIYGGGNIGMKCPLGCCADENQNIYVADCGNQRIVKLHFNADDNELQYQGAFLLPNQGVPWDVTYWNGSIYLTDCKNHQILKYDTSGNLLSTYGSYGSDDRQFYKPQGIAAIRDTVYVADMGNRRMVALKDNGGGYFWIRTYYLTELDRPWLQDVEVDNGGGVYVIEHLNCEIFKFAPGLTTLLDRFGNQEDGPFQWPRFMGICGEDGG